MLSNYYHTSSVEVGEIVIIEDPGTNRGIRPGSKEIQARIAALGGPGGLVEVIRIVNSCYLELARVDSQGFPKGPLHKVDVLRIRKLSPLEQLALQAE